MGPSIRAGPPDPDEEWGRWVAWLEGPKPPSISDDVLAMMASRQMWDGFRIVRMNAPAKVLENPTFASWVADNYVRSLSLTIRRQTDSDPDVVSLARLIQQVSRYPHVLSRERYAARTAGWQSRPEAEGFFEELVGPGRDHIDRNAARADFATLRHKTAKVTDWVDNEVAHYNQGKGILGIGLKFRDLHDAASLIIDLFVKYRLLILGSSMAKSISMYPWVGAFRLPWISDDDHWRRVENHIREIERRREAGERLEDDE